MKGRTEQKAPCAKFHVRSAFALTVDFVIDDIGIMGAANLMRLDLVHVWCLLDLFLHLTAQSFVTHWMFLP